MNDSRLTTIMMGMTERVTQGMKVIMSDHANIHAREGFSISGLITSLANNGTTNYAFKTPSVASGKIIHLKQKEFYSSGTKIRTDFYEAPTNAPTNGSALTAYNHSRIDDVIPVSTMQSIKAVMDLDLTGATNLETLLMGNQSAPRSSDLERVLKPNTWYIRTFTNLSGGSTDINFFEFWYEEEDG